MGNPFIRSDAFQHDQPAQQEDPAKGILTWLAGGIISGGSMELPPAGPEQPESAQAVVDAAHLGKVRITYALKSYKHGRSKHWHWVAVRADRAGDPGEPGVACDNAT